MTEEVNQSLDQTIAERTERGGRSRGGRSLGPQNGRVDKSTSPAKPRGGRPNTRSRMADSNFEPGKTGVSEPAGGEFMKVGGGMTARDVAARVARMVRSKNIYPILATGPQALNVSIKAVAIARKYVNEDADGNGPDIYIQPAFRDRKMGKSLALYLSTKPRNAPKKQLDELTVSSKSVLKDVAGAIANRARDGQAVRISAIGPDAVCNAIVSVCKARLYLEEDGIDLKAMPEFVEVDKSDEMSEERTVTALQLSLSIEEV